GVGDGNALPALFSRCLQRCTVQPVVCCHHLGTAPYPQLILIRTRAIHHSTSPYYIVSDDDRARTGELPCPFKIHRVVRLISVNEDEVKRAFEPGQHIGCCADTDIHLVSAPGGTAVFKRDICPQRVEFDGGYTAFRLQGASHPDGAVPT